jgi:predicted RNase H-like HicB family nuclease
VETEFTVIMNYDHSSGAYIVRVPALRGVVSDGATEQEALENVKDAIAEWIAARRALGLAITEVKEYRVKVLV